MALFPLFTAEVLEGVVAAVSSLLVPIVGRSLGLQPSIDSFLRHVKPRVSTSSTADLQQRLKSASSEMDSVIGELQAAADEQLTKVTTLQNSINELIQKEKDLRERIEGTEGLSKATVEALGKIVAEKLETAERPKKKRDYALFAAGVIVSGVVGIGIEATKPIWEKALHVQVESPTAVKSTDTKQTTNKP